LAITAGALIELGVLDGFTLNMSAMNCPHIALKELASQVVFSVKDVPFPNQDRLLFGSSNMLFTMVGGLSWGDVQFLINVIWEDREHLLDIQAAIDTTPGWAFLLMTLSMYAPFTS
jgi:hypothetical protein